MGKNSRHKNKFESISACPHKVLFTKGVICDHFSCGRAVQSTIDELSSGTVSAQDIPAIRVVRRSGKLLTLDHRRLYAFQKALPANALVPMKVVTCELLTQGLP